ncbi:biotin synthase BioB [Limibacter armeniacum]|uniref:biotin synthase BioB n=1 Tax=Limibacter armeniacum TaxID=466084 RepID=UPI002FE5D42B
MSTIRNNWTREEITEIYNTPIMELMYRAGTVHREFHDPNEVQVCTLLSVKTGGCKEDCSYCSQSVRYNTHVKPEKMMGADDIIVKAKQAKQAGSTRFCMGAAWREVRENRDFDTLLNVVSEVNGMGMEVCVTLGMVNEQQAQKLKEAGLHAYNHNLDTGKEYYDKVITTRTFDDRLDTIHNLQKANVNVCSGGIIGLGEQHEDRISMLHTLSTLPKHPESVPVNALVAVEGTPMEGNERVPVWDMVRMIATARILMPKAMVRLSAGRKEMPLSEQAMCFMAGANSIFAGDKLLTTPNPEKNDDNHMFRILNLKPRVAFKGEGAHV